MAGVWLCSAPWRDAHVDLISGLVRASNCNLKFIPGSFTTPDFIATITSGSTVAFIVVTNAAYLSSSILWKRFVESDNTPLLQIQDKMMPVEMMMELARGHAGVEAVLAP